MTELDIMTKADLDADIIYTEWLRPNGWVAATGTHFKGLTGNPLLFTLEGCASTEAARAIIPELDTLRPHIARALTLSAQLDLQRAQTMTDTLKAIGVAAGVIGLGGQIKSVNDLFEPLIGRSVLDGTTGIRLKDSSANTLLQTTLAQMRRSAQHARSIPLRGTEGEPAQILHLIPLVREARDMMWGDNVLLILNGHRHLATGPVSLQGDHLQALFDLTPAEARLVRYLVQGQKLNQISVETGLSFHTLRTQLRAVMAKTGVKSQAALVSMLFSLSLTVKV